MTEQTFDERLDVIANKSVEMLQTTLERGLKASGSKSIPVLVKDIGEALKTLAEGIEACKKTMAEESVVHIPNTLPGRTVVKERKSAPRLDSR